MSLENVEKISQQKQQKFADVQNIKEMLSKAKSFVVVNYSGLNVAQDTELRNAFRKADVQYSVLKNRLIKIALDELGYEGFDEALNGPTALAVSDTDEVAPAKIVKEKSEAFKKMEIKCAMVDGKFFTKEEAERLAKLPSKEGLVSQVLCMLLAPLSGFARAIQAIADKQQA